MRFYSYSELLTRIQKYIRVEEGAVTRREDNGKPKTKQAKRELIRDQIEKPNLFGRPNSGSRNLVNKLGNFTPFLVSVPKFLWKKESNIFEGLIRWSLTFCNKCKYYRFYRNMSTIPKTAFSWRGRLKILFGVAISGSISMEVLGLTPKNSTGSKYKLRSITNRLLVESTWSPRGRVLFKEVERSGERECNFFFW